jgi:hypothetical protein
MSLDGYQNGTFDRTKMGSDGTILAGDGTKMVRTLNTLRYLRVPSSIF